MRWGLISLEKYKQVIHEDFTRDVDFMNEIIIVLNLDKKSKILDIGTGLGAMSILLAINGFDVLTGEPEEDPERDNRDHHEHNHGKNHEEYDSNHHGFYYSDWRESAKAVGVEDKIKFQYLNAENLNFPNETFDGIFMYDALQHIHNRGVVLKECVRVLKPEALIGVIEWGEKQIEEEYKKYGYEIDFIDPRDFINIDNISVEIFTGEAVIIYILRKI